MKKLLAISMVLLPAVTMAQERSAGQAYDAQVNWAALNNKIDLVSNQNKVLTSTIAKFQACNLKKRIYIPTDTAADADGCVAITGTPCGARSFTIVNSPQTIANCPAIEHGTSVRCPVTVATALGFRGVATTIQDNNKHFIGQCHNGVVSHVDYFDVTPTGGTGSQPYNPPNGSNGGAGG